MNTNHIIQTLGVDTAHSSHSSSSSSEDEFPHPHPPSKVSYETERMYILTTLTHLSQQVRDLTKEIDRLVRK